MRHYSISPRPFNCPEQTLHGLQLARWVPIYFLERNRLDCFDGLPACHDAYKKGFWTSRGTKTEHVNAIKLSGNVNNNKMERFNGEIRDREKTMRGLKRKEIAILTGYQILLNCIRIHEGLEGKTHVEACGIQVQGDNKWKTLIQNASISKKKTKPYQQTAKVSAIKRARGSSSSVCPPCIFSRAVSLYQYIRLQSSLFQRQQLMIHTILSYLWACEF